MEKAKSDLSSHCGDLEEKLNYRLSLDLQNQKDEDSTVDTYYTMASGETPNESKEVQFCFGFSLIFYHLIVYNRCTVRAWIVRQKTNVQDVQR